jgi:hypothetical protein
VSRRQHYRDFYDGVPPGDRPLGLVHGNCQAEALRILLAGSPDLPWTLVRLPPVHELEADDLPALERLLGRCRLLVSQPVRDDYRDLPLGTAQVQRRLAAGAVTVRIPIVRWTGLHPWQAIVRVPDGAAPPVVPYHDLRTLTGRPSVEPDLRAAAERSLAELALRERRDADVAVSDVLPGLGVAAMHTLNHPGSASLLALAQRVLGALGLPPSAADPGRELLGGVRAPLEPEALDALGLDTRLARAHWVVERQVVHADVVRAAQRRWYDARPDAVQAGLARHGPRLAELGLG